MYASPLKAARNAPWGGLLVLAALMLSACGRLAPGDAAAPGAAVSPSESPREQVLSLVRAEADGTLQGPPLALRVDHYAHAADWVFLTARMLGPEGADYPLERSSLRELALAGEAEPRLSALARRDQLGAWQVVAMDLASTDIPWLAWPLRYSAPAEVFPAFPASEVPAWGSH